MTRHQTLVLGMALLLAPLAAATRLRAETQDLAAISVACGTPGRLQTKEIRGPTGVAAAIIINSHDDYNKNSHQCESNYVLKLRPDPAPAKKNAIGFSVGIAEWARPLSARLDGFSADGKLVFGIVSEGGQFPSTQIIAGATSTGGVAIYDITKASRVLHRLKCGRSFQVVGMTHGQDIVVAPYGGGPCVRHIVSALPPIRHRTITRSFARCRPVKR